MKSNTIKVTMFKPQQAQIKTVLELLSAGWAGVQSSDTGHYYLLDDDRSQVPRIISNSIMHWMLKNGIVEAIGGEVKLKDGRPEIEFIKSN